jgi:hypothetical protein
MAVSISVVITSYPAAYTISVAAQTMEADDISAILDIAILHLVSGRAVDELKEDGPASQPVLVG